MMLTKLAFSRATMTALLVMIAVIAILLTWGLLSEPDPAAPIRSGESGISNSLPAKGLGLRGANDVLQTPAVETLRQRSLR